MNQTISRCKFEILPLILVLTCLIQMRANAQDSIAKNDSSQINRKILYKALALEGAYYVGSMIILQNTWYSNRKNVPFHFYNDNKGYLQIDKFGHAYGAYVESYIGYHCLLHAGISRNIALIFGGTLGLIMQTPIEIMDGIHEGWGFSWGDMLANAVGSGLFVGQELFFNEQIVNYKFSYMETVYSKNANGYLGISKTDRLLKDYNGHTYWITIPVNRLIPVKQIPDWLNIAVGYGANGMYGEYKNPTNFGGIEIPFAVRYRQYLFSFDIDLTEIKTHSKVLKFVFQGLNFIKLPFPTLEYNSMGKFKGYWIY